MQGCRVHFVQWVRLVQVPSRQRTQDKRSHSRSIIVDVTKHAILSLLGAAAAAPALADQVSYVKLEIHRAVDAAHAQKVYARIRSAARQVFEGEQHSNQ